MGAGRSLESGPFSFDRTYYATPLFHLARLLQVLATACMRVAPGEGSAVAVRSDNETRQFGGLPMRRAIQLDRVEPDDFSLVLFISLAGLDLSLWLLAQGYVASLADVFMLM